MFTSILENLGLGTSDTGGSALPGTPVPCTQRPSGCWELGARLPAIKAWTKSRTWMALSHKWHLREVHRQIAKEVRFVPLRVWGSDLGLRMAALYCLTGRVTGDSRGLSRAGSSGFPSTPQSASQARLCSRRCSSHAHGRKKTRSSHRP